MTDPIELLTPIGTRLEEITWKAIQFGMPPREALAMAALNFLEAAFTHPEWGRALIIDHSTDTSSLVNGWLRDVPVEARDD